jgi:hypothetical protein
VVSTIDQQRQGPGLGDAAIGWLALWDEADAIYEGLPAGHRALIVKAAQGLDILPAVFATLDPDLRAEVTVVLRQMVGVLTDACGVSRLPERCPPGCDH